MTLSIAVMKTFSDRAGDRRQTYDMKALVQMVVDKDSSFEIKANPWSAGHHHVGASWRPARWAGGE